MVRRINPTKTLTVRTHHEERSCLISRPPLPRNCLVQTVHSSITKPVLTSEKGRKILSKYFKIPFKVTIFHPKAFVLLICFNSNIYKAFILTKYINVSCSAYLSHAIIRPISITTIGLCFDKCTDHCSHQRIALYMPVQDFKLRALTHRTTVCFRTQRTMAQNYPPSSSNIPNVG